MTYARFWETLSRSKRAQEQGSSPSGADVASIPARLCDFLPVSLKGTLELYRASPLDPGYKGGGYSIRATKTKLAQINPGNGTNCWAKSRRHRSASLVKACTFSLNIMLSGGEITSDPCLRITEFQKNFKTSTLSDSVKNRYFRTVFFLKHIVMS